MSRPSGGWRKKPETRPEISSASGDEESKRREEVVQERKEVSESDSSPSSEEEEEDKQERVNIPVKEITETDLNEIGAKIVKAEIMGNEVCIVESQSFIINSCVARSFCKPFSVI